MQHCRAGLTVLLPQPCIGAETGGGCDQRSHPSPHLPGENQASAFTSLPRDEDKKRSIPCMHTTLTWIHASTLHPFLNSKTRVSVCTRPLGPISPSGDPPKPKHIPHTHPEPTRSFDTWGIHALTPPGVYTYLTAIACTPTPLTPHKTHACQVGHTHDTRRPAPHMMKPHACASP